MERVNANEDMKIIPYKAICHSHHSVSFSDVKLIYDALQVVIHLKSRSRVLECSVPFLYEGLEPLATYHSQPWILT